MLNLLNLIIIFISRTVLAGLKLPEKFHHLRIQNKLYDCYKISYKTVTKLNYGWVVLSNTITVNEWWQRSFWIPQSKTSIMDVPIQDYGQQFISINKN